MNLVVDLIADPFLEARRPAPGRRGGPVRSPLSFAT